MNQNYQYMKYMSGNIKFVPLFLLVALLASGAGAWYGATQGSSFSGSKRDTSAELDKIQEQLVNTLILPEDFRTVPSFALLDKNGANVGINILQGKWSMLFFGFTHCPDVCPITLTEVEKALSAIKQDYADLPAAKVVFVSVDPKRDTPELLKGYVEFFDPNFTALTGELNNVLELTQSLSIVVSYTADKDNPENYTVDHTAAILLVDPELRVRAKFNAPHTKDVIVKDYLTLMHHWL